MRYLINKVVERVVVKKFDTYEECEEFIKNNESLELDSKDGKFLAVMKVERTIRH